tara:strand:- start:18441 stop:19238 length:798 start_codon:yes stop_codon:yes gene_type:complete
LVLLGMAPVVSQAAPQCQPQTEYEKLYCQIKAKDANVALPSFEDFRRNDPQVQALLLKRPAARWGLAVPSPKVAPRPENSAAPKASAQVTPPAIEPPSRKSPAFGNTGLGECILQGDSIRCPGRQFELVSNQPNRALPNGVLSEENKLGLPSFTGDLKDEVSVRRYLSTAYDRYIVKMLEIGLGGATMSFTRFYNGFWRHQSQGVDYAQRMESTYHYLKQDKKTLAVKARLHSKLPANLDNCSAVNGDILVCDDVATSWVFVRAG